MHLPASPPPLASQRAIPSTRPRKRIRVAAIIALLIGTAALGLLATPDAEAAAPVITPLSPATNETIYNRTPLLVVQFTDPDDDLRAETLRLRLGAVELTGNEEIRFDGARMEYEVPAFFALRPGPNNVTVAIADQTGETTTLTYVVHFDPAGPPRAAGGIALRDIVLVVLVVFAVLVTGLAGLAVYLYKVKGLTYRKLVARYPIKREIFTLYLPLAIGTTAAVAALAFLSGWDQAPRLGPEYAVMGALFIALGPYALDVKAQRALRRRHERAFGQFLFELADAMRGGIDPIKATLGIAGTETGILRRPLRQAADGIRLGRPFETVMRSMGKAMKSHLIDRYAALVGEASKVGGEVATVVYRAAKDMDELVKIDAERARQMKTPMFTMYVAFGVLFMMTAVLMDFAPELARLDISQLGSAGLGDLAAGGGAARLSLPVLERRFLHLLLIMSIGTGLLIGSFTQGKPRDGFLHALFMVAVTLGLYPVVVL